MKKIFQIFARDMRRLFTNPAAAIVMVGVCVLPSLYAWFNIAANMDPYGNTSNIKVAIANCDAGASRETMSLDAGGTIVDTLKKNKQLGWTFVDEKQAKAGVTSGKYYAAIVIPENFSESLLSILDGEVKQPELDYYINEKKNAIAPKITATGASTIQQQINDTFSSVAAETVSELIRTSAGDLTGKIDKSNSELSTALSETRDNLKEYQKVLKNFEETSGSSEKLIKDALETLDAVSSAADSGSKTLTDTTALLAASRQSLGSFSSQFSSALSNGETLLNNTYASAIVKLGTFETKASQVNTVIGDSIDSVTSLNQKQAELLAELQKLHESIGSDSTLSGLIGEKITVLQQQNASFQELLDSLSTSNSSIQEAMTTAQNTRTSLEKLVTDSRSSLQTYRNSLNESLIPKLSQSMDTLSTLSGTLTATLSDVNPTIEQLKLILTQLDASLSDSSAALGQTGGVLDTIDQQLSTITTDLGVLQSSDIYNQLITLKGLDVDSISDFMSSPVSIQSKVLYEVENYGSGMTPFYTNLALWVGGLILVSILKQEVDKDEKISRFTPSQAYFGRWLVFVIMGLIQGFIVCAGDIILLKTQCLHPAAFILAGMFCSFVYVNLIYAMALTFKHIGKALAVLLVILQIPGSSGTYPIEMTPIFFQKLHPLLPFSYGISAMRECIAGFYGHTYAKNLGILALFLLLALFIGLVLRLLLMNLNHLFDRRLAETDLMLGETASDELQRPQMQLMLRALMRDDEARKEFMEKSERFERRYPYLIRYGFLAIVIIPLIFLILMFSLESKIVYLILWIVSLIALVLYLICVEYIHDKIRRQMELGGITSEDLVHVIEEEKDDEKYMENFPAGSATDTEKMSSP